MKRKRDASQNSIIIEKMLKLKLIQLKKVYQGYGFPRLALKQEYQTALQSIIEGNDEVSEKDRNKIIQDILSISSSTFTNERKPLKTIRIMPNDISIPNGIKIIDTTKTVQHVLSTTTNATALQIKKLPFYDLIAVLMTPKLLDPKQCLSYQISLFELNLLSDHVEMIYKYSNGPKYDVKVLLRFCLFDTSAPQDDKLPLNLNVDVNGCSCELPNFLPSRPGDTPKRSPEPVDITKYLKISPQVSNKISIKWTQELSKNYLVSIYLVHKRTSDELFQRIKAKGIKPLHCTSDIIKEKLRDDAEIATTLLKTSLICPLSKTRMITPCRASTCKHLQCFDALSYLLMNERHPKWICPVCNVEISYDNLVIDGYFLSVITSLKNDEATEIQLHPDGTWTKLEEVKSNDLIKEKSSKPSDIVEISDSEDEDVQNNNKPASSKKSEPFRDGDSVDLTLDDD